ncbi:MAG: ChuX/HutX family heme-like substrate-binding protein [Pseudomonadota bacterium]
MNLVPALAPADIRAARAAESVLRERDLAAKLGISEAELLAAHTGEGVVRIDPHPDGIMAAAQSLGNVMALTRNESCVIEKTGLYEEYHPGNHAAMVLGRDIDLRIFPSHWSFAFQVEKKTEGGVRRSLQVFDAAGDAVHKIFLVETSKKESWDEISSRLKLDEQTQSLVPEGRVPPEPPKADPSKRSVLLKEWERLTDTHQFLRLASKLKMNRLGAYHTAGPPLATPLKREAADAALARVRDAGIEIMLFVGNRGCIEIHSGPIGILKPMGPWQNVLDPGFNLHLRLDRIHEVWAVDKPTRRGSAISIETFDEHGQLIFQVFGVGKEGRDSRPAWNAIVDDLSESMAMEFSP